MLTYTRKYKIIIWSIFMRKGWPFLFYTFLFFILM